MKDFDAAIKSHHGVFRFYRFADDIITLTTSRPAELSQLMDARLPSPMVFHRTTLKRADVELPGKTKGPPPPPTDIEYLGYRFQVTQTNPKPSSRVVRVSFSGRKVRKLQSRILLAARDHSISPNWSLFLDRVTFLTSNHRVMRGHVVAAKDSPFIKTGLFYNYRACGTHQYADGRFVSASYDLLELKQLDGFLHSVLKKLITASAPPQNVADELKRRSFARGYALRIYHAFKPDDVAVIKRCWSHI
jgi:hypothetical protein